jgi:hypothetical protein
MSETLKIGSSLWYCDDEYKIVGETTRSWIVPHKRSWKPAIPVRKTDLTAVSDDRNYSSCRRQFRTAEQMQARVEEAKWRASHEKEVTGLIQRWGSRIECLKAAYKGLVEAGILKETP